MFYPSNDVGNHLFFDAVETVIVRGVTRVSHRVATAIPSDLHWAAIGEARLKVANALWGCHMTFVISVVTDENEA